MTVSARVIKQFEIYWANLDPTVGSEIKKRRPCVVVSPDVMNKTLKTVLVVPVTSTIINWPFRMLIKSIGKESSAACDQLRTVSIERLSTKIGSLNQTEQKQILDVLVSIFSL
jgi:mRNA interferase MazF